uniref:C-type lectin mannose-binding isoform-like n=1 Tax=Styela clava TaxID=7725 RepID=UPI00193AB360|nr:C-type lectin mannose-binding isoform-like [Styela clava]
MNHVCWANRPGKRGPAGPKGEQGEPGLDGVSGMKGDKGDRGICDCADISQTQDALQIQEERLRLAAKDWYMVEDSNAIQYWFKVFYDKSNYQDAKINCVKHNAKLAAKGLRISSVLKEVVDRLVRPLNKPVWIGLDDLMKQNTWVWSDGVHSTRTNTAWGSGQPSNSHERCGDFYPGINFQINDAPCSYAYFYLCEKVLLE